jgi:hypothetical protein
MESFLFVILVKQFQHRVARFVSALWAYIMLGDFNEIFAQQLHSDCRKRHEEFTYPIVTRKWLKFYCIFLKNGKFCKSLW